MVYFVGSFWRQNVTINNEESPLVSMQQRPLIVPATLHFSGLPQKSSIYTQEAITGKTINLTLFFFLAEHFLFISARSSCFSHIPVHSFYFTRHLSLLAWVFLFFFPPQPSLSFLTVHPPLACVQTPSPQEKSEKGLLLRFFLRGEGSIHRQEGDGLLTQAIHFSFIFPFVLPFVIARFGGSASFSLIKFP